MAGPTAAEAAKLALGERVRIMMDDGAVEVVPDRTGGFEVIDLAAVHDVRAAGALVEIELRLRRAREAT